MLTQIELLGIRCHVFTIESLTGLVLEKAKADDKTIIAHQNLHGIYHFHRNSEFRDFFGLANYVQIDGMPIVYWGKIVGYNVNRENRITYVDWVSPLMAMSNKNKLKIFYLGGSPGVGRSAISVLQAKYSDIEFDERHGYFDMYNINENKSVLEDIERFSPDILMVGMSMPRQEIWIKNNIDRLPNCVILPCGACFDYLAGQVKTPPRYLGAIGLEWLYRFCQEPKRLFSRYFIEPLFLLPFLLKDLKKRSFRNIR